MLWLVKGSLKSVSASSFPAASFDSPGAGERLTVPPTATKGAGITTNRTSFFGISPNGSLPAKTATVNWR